MMHTISLFLFLCLILLSSCNILESGENKILTEVYNGKQSKKAILFLKGGNATTDNSLQIKLAGYVYQLEAEDVGNVLRSDSNYGKVELDSSAISVAWQDDTLVIVLDKELRTFTKMRR